MLYFGDLRPSIEENEDPAYRLKILGLVHDSGKLTRLKVTNNACFIHL